jgi:hypothetical protein
MTAEIPKNGSFTDFYMSDTSQMKLKGTYKDGKQEGKWNEWWINGQKKSEGNYKDGKLDGIFTEWNNYGEKIFEATYKNGVKYKNGNIVEMQNVRKESDTVALNDKKNTNQNINENKETVTVEMRGTQTVKVSDFDMPFGSMVVFMVKWAIASIPALIILMILFAIFGGFTLAIFN